MQQENADLYTLLTPKSAVGLSFYEAAIMFILVRSLMHLFFVFLSCPAQFFRYEGDKHLCHAFIDKQENGFP